MALHSFLSSRWFVVLASAVKPLLVLSVALGCVSPNGVSVALNALLGEQVLQKTLLLVIQLSCSLLRLYQGVLLPHKLPNTPVLLSVVKNADDVDAWSLLPMRTMTAAGVVLAQEIDHEDQLMRLVDDPIVVLPGLLPSSLLLAIPVNRPGSIVAMTNFNCQFVAVTLHVVTSPHDRR